MMLKNQELRYKSTIKNGLVNKSIFDKNVTLNFQQKEILGHFIQKGTLTARSANNITRVARTIADLDNCEKLQAQHITQALQLRYNLH